MLPDVRGLAEREAEERLKEYGLNVLPEKPPRSNLSILISQVRSPLIYVLIFAGVVTGVLGHISDTVIIVFAITLNTILGYVQESRAGKAIEALKKLVTHKATVIRESKRKKIPAEKLVPGDIVVLTPGEKVPADGKLTHANRLFLDESILTGESIPVSKIEKDEIFMGTIISSGQGMFEITRTGKDTKIGDIAKQVQETSEVTPLKKQISRFSKSLLVLVLILTIIVFLFGLILGQDVVEIFTTAVALAVSAIPEGLLVSLTVVLAIGMQRISKRKGLVRNLTSAETLGSVTTICVDKTGTLTAGEMKVTETVGNIEALAQQIVTANDLDDPLVIAGYEWGKSKVNSHLPKRVDSIPFSSKNRFFACLVDGSKNHTLFVNGSPEELLEWSNLSKNEKEGVKKEITFLSKKGRRLLGFAKKKMAKDVKKITDGDIKSNLEWVGLLAFSDPVRPSVADAIVQTAKAGIKIVVITGDYVDTARFVMRELGVEVQDTEVIQGNELEKMDSSILAKKVKTVKLFARTTPDQKLKIVEALKQNGEIVAMMGDGVNDAPAINKADIGIVVGDASDVSKESSDLILLDSDFSTIVAAIEEGRGIFDNLRKIILYLMSDSFEEIIAVIGSMIIGLPLPVTAAQILWINLVSDGLPDLALTVDQKSPNIMLRHPRPVNEHLVTGWMKLIIVVVSLTGGLTALGLFLFFHTTTGGDPLARSVAFAALGINSLVYVFSIRTLLQPFWKENPLENKWLNFAFLGGVGLQVIPLVDSKLGALIGVVPLQFEHWAAVIISAIIMFVIIEMLKVVIVKAHK